MKSCFRWNQNPFGYKPHYMKRIFTVLIIFIWIQTAASAEEKSKSKKASQRSQSRALMKEQIKLLKEGVLLIRLQTQNNSITALNEANQYRLASKIKEKQEKKNRKIVAAFRKNFTFCPVYFFTSNYSINILSKHTNEIIFLNDSLQPDTSVKLNSAKFLTAEFGIIDRDTAKYYSDYYYYRGKRGTEYKNIYYSGPDMGFEALKIMSDRFVQLKNPFPFKVRTFSSLPVIRRKPSKTVRRMNKKLLKFYQETVPAI